MNPKGKKYMVNETLNEFPSYAAGLLKSKKHEWIIVAFEGDKVVKGFWANKGPDRESVGVTCGYDHIFSLCHKYNCHTLLKFHNHPNAVLSPSDKDLSSAGVVSKLADEHGYNVISFVCGAGRFVEYHRFFSPKFMPNEAAVATLSEQNGLSEWSNYRMHVELGLIFRGRLSE